MAWKPKHVVHSYMQALYHVKNFDTPKSVSKL